MIQITVAGVVGNDPQSVDIGDKRYVKISVAHHVKDDTVWVTCLLYLSPGSEYIHKGSRIVVTGSGQLGLYNDMPTLTVWANSYANLTPR